MAMASRRDIRDVERSFRRLAYWHEVIEVRRPAAAVHTRRALGENCFA
jgi:hypothetical protein